MCSKVAVPGFLPSPTSTAPVVVAGVPVDMESAPPYDPQPAHGTYAAAPLEAKAIPHLPRVIVSIQCVP